MLSHLLFIPLLAGALPAQAVVEAKPLPDIKLSQLEQRLTELDAELSQLAQYSPRGGTGSISYRSENHANPNNTEWVQIDLREESLIDQIVLVPSIRRDTQAGFHADGFPVQFEIRTGTQADSSGTLVARFDESDLLLPRIAPLIVPCPGTTASWVRVEASRLSQRAFDDRYGLKLAELLVFNGQENLALNSVVSASYNTRSPLQRERASRFLNDGLLPYLMDAAHGEKSIAVICGPSEQQAPVITIDLEAPYALNRIHLHAVDPSDTLPLAFTGDLGIPGLLRIEGANRADFSDATLLLDNSHRNAYDAGPILMRQIPETTCRYIRLTQLKPYADQAHGLNRLQMGFAEIELFSEGRNVALHKPARVNFKHTNAARTSSALTDGRNFYGNILPVRTWMEQLARRHDLETERPKVMQELTRRYAQQKTMVRWLGWLTAALILGSLTLILIEMIARQRAIARTRKRIAANLHDELGANLHAIGLLGDFAKKIVDRKQAREEWTELTDVIDEVRTLTEETGHTARYCTNLLEAKEIHSHLVEEMKRITSRLLTDVEHEVTFPDEQEMQHLAPRRRIDLYLFYKECLTNILRHSHATRVSVQLTASRRAVSLIITDNGQGLPNNEVPESLHRRARLLRGQVTAEPIPDGGTRIMLQFRPRRRWGGTRVGCGVSSVEGKKQ